MDNDMPQTPQEIQARIRELETKIRQLKKLKFDMETNAPPKTISCSHCKTEEISGITYRCVVCADFSLCAACEKKEIHSHPMIRLPEPINERLFRKTVKAMKRDDNIDEKKIRKMKRFCRDSTNFVRPQIKEIQTETTDHFRKQKEEFLNNMFDRSVSPLAFEELLRRFAVLSFEEFKAVMELYN